MVEDSLIKAQVSPFAIREGEIKSFDSDIANTNKTGLGKLFTSVKKQLEKLIAGYEKIEVNIDKIEASLEKHRLQMLKDITIFDTMYEKN